MCPKSFRTTSILKSSNGQNLNSNHCQDYSTRLLYKKIPSRNPICMVVESHFELRNLHVKGSVAAEVVPVCLRL